MLFEEVKLGLPRREEKQTKEHEVMLFEVERMLLPRREEQTKEHEVKETKECVVMLFEEERLGPAALEARGDQFMAAVRRRRGTILDIWEDLQNGALCYVIALNWRKAALAFGEHAAYDLEVGDELSAASGLLRSARCYIEMEDKEEGEIAATKLALEKAIELFVKTNDLQMAAVNCLELAEFYMEQQELQNALDFFEQAADYYGDRYRHNSRHCMTTANLLRFTLDNQETLRGKGVIPFEDYKGRRSRGCII